MISPTTSLPSTGHRYARVLSIAGSDSGGGAGIQADLKTFSALGCYGMTAITAITAQNTCGVTGIHGIPPEMLKAQIDAVVQDIGVDAVKIGMLHSPDVVHVVAEAIRTYQLPHVVLDLPGDWVVDVLAVQGGAQGHRLQSQRIATHNGHGTGCTLSSAIAAHLALGLPLEQAVEQARAYILGAIAAGANVTTGRGHGPLNHGYAPVAQRVFQAP